MDGESASRSLVVGSNHAPCLVELAGLKIASPHPDFKVSGVAKPPVKMCPAFHTEYQHISIFGSRQGTDLVKDIVGVSGARIAVAIQM